MNKTEFEARKKEDERILKMIRERALKGDPLALVAFALIEVSRSIDCHD
jgi:hypothetical protein